MLKKINKDYYSLDKQLFFCYTQGTLKGVPGIQVIKNPTTHELLSVELHKSHIPLISQYIQNNPENLNTYHKISAPYKLRSYQQDAIYFARERYGSCMFHDLGLGKTSIALGAAEYPGIVLCPSSAIHVWLKEAHKFGLKTQVLQGLSHIPSDITGADLYITTYGSCEATLPLFAAHVRGTPKLKTKILDEAHVFHKIYTSSKLSQVHSAINSAYTDHIIALTATPLRNRLKSLHGILHAVAPGAFGNLSTFRIRYCGASPDSYGKLKDMDLTNTDELLARLATICIRESWTNPELASLRPKLHRVSLPVELPPDVRCENLLKVLHDTYRSFNCKGTTLKFLTAQKVKVGEMKLKWLTEQSSLIAKLQERHPRIIWWVYHKDTIAKKLKKALDNLGTRPCDYVDGDTTQVARTKILIEWEEGDPSSPRDLVCTIPSMNSAVNLTTAQAAVICELSWAPIELQQLEARHHRPGNKYSDVYAYYLSIPHTIDDKLTQALLEKVQESEALNLTSQLNQMLTLISSTTDELF